MDNLATTYQHIADILSFETTDSELEKTLSNPKFNWDAIVVEGSKHLILPALYCRLKAKGLLLVLPDELNTYLEEITSINRNRNTSILKQVHILSQLLNQHNVNHLFLKGTALLAADYYNDIAERMIGDIDILVDLKQLDFAFNLLQNNGYTPIEQTFGDTFFEHKHLPRLKTKKNISAVELHRKLFVTYKEKELSNANLLAYKRKKNNVSIPSQEHLFNHNILNYQINDYGNLYNGISFRSIYDTISLQRRQKMDITTYKNRVFKKYFRLAGLFFEDIQKMSGLKTNFTTAFYHYKLRHRVFYKFWNRLLKLTHFFTILLKRIPYLLTNKAYRKALFADRRRVYNYFISILNNS
ncbi:nucleotidyltransferase family protein [Winogradskyella luteola]|uniref:Nucleotidyltransferase family protein n=1 Tax=Winogradskyella luteola TaxID=2828330 RepID=A0A9X1JN73_9FLAO|nr:nucleotidyltransferase family protein [Winogradskyella luteola]MBV7269260.1 nucleotidyltransferase family protein [Winogradskyella luteola]